MESQKAAFEPPLASAVWLVVALVLAALSIYLTHLITNVDRHPRQLGLLVYAEVGSAAASTSLPGPRLSFVTTQRGLDLTFERLSENPQLVQLVFGPIPREIVDTVRCKTGLDDDLRDSPTLAPGTMHTIASPAKTDEIYSELGLRPLPAGPAHPVAGDLRSFLNGRTDYESGDPRAQPFLALSVPRGGTARAEAITCHLPDLVVHDTFTSRTFQLVVPRDTSGGLKLVDPDAVSFVDEDEHDPRASTVNTGSMHFGTTVPGPFPRSTVKRTFPAQCVEVPVRGSCVPPLPFDSGDLIIEFAWDSITAAQVRDIYIVIIGSLIALAAAAVIEAARPFIELYVSRVVSSGAVNS
jgi:hypothetical protein